jgi:uncharacterized protein (UPF0335 family)
MGKQSKVIPLVGGNGYDSKTVKSFVARIEDLYSQIRSIMGKAMAECKYVHADIKTVYDEAKDEAGIPKKALKSVIKVRDLERKADKLRDNLEDDIQEPHDMIRFALGDLADTPLGQAALELSEPDVRPDFLQRQEREREAVADMGDAPGTYEQN